MTAESHSFTGQLITMRLANKRLSDLSLPLKTSGWGSVLTLFVFWQACDAGHKKTLLSAEYLNEPFRAQRAMSVVSIMTSVLEGKRCPSECQSTVL